MYDPATMANRAFRLILATLLVTSAALAIAETRTDPNNITGSTGLVMIDKRGVIRYEGYGEFHLNDRTYKLWDRRIRELLEE